MISLAPVAVIIITTAAGACVIVVSLASLGIPCGIFLYFLDSICRSIDLTNLAGQDMNIIILENALSVKLISDTSGLQENPENTVIICECNWSVSVCGRIYSRTHRNCFGPHPPMPWSYSTTLKT